MYRAKAQDSADGTGGWRSLCKRALVGNKKDRTRLASYEDARILHYLNEVLLNSSKGVRSEDVMHLIDNLVHQMQKAVDVKLCEKSFSIIPSCLPRTFTDARRILLDGRHSVMQNYPAAEVSLLVIMLVYL